MGRADKSGHSLLAKIFPQQYRRRAGARIAAPTKAVAILPLDSSTSLLRAAMQ
jgi:hypothetical protein